MSPLGTHFRESGLREGQLTRLISIWRSEGPQAVWFRVLGVLGYRRMLLLECPLTSPIEVPTRPPNYEFALVDRSAIPALRTLRSDLSASELESRFANDDVCLVARFNGQIVSASWASKRKAWIPYVDCDLDICDDEVWLCDAWTNPEHRSAGLVHFLATDLLRRFHEQGYRRALSAILPERKLWSETGFRSYGILSSMRILSRVFHWQRLKSR